jgi:hypothetical protein
VHHVAVQISEVLTSLDGHSRKHTNRSDAAIRQRSQMRGVLFIQLHLAGDGKFARYLLRLDSPNLYPGAPLGIGRDPDHIVALSAAIAALVGGLRIGRIL